MNAVKSKTKGKIPDKIIIIFNKKGKVLDESLFIEDNYEFQYKNNDVILKNDKITNEESSV